MRCWKAKCTHDGCGRGSKKQTRHDLWLVDKDTQSCIILSHEEERERESKKKVRRRPKLQTNVARIDFSFSSSSDFVPWPRTIETFFFSFDAIYNTSERSTWHQLRELTFENIYLLQQFISFKLFFYYLIIYFKALLFFLLLLLPLLPRNESVFNLKTFSFLRFLSTFQTKRKNGSQQKWDACKHSLLLFFILFCHI